MWGHYDQCFKGEVKKIFQEITKKAQERDEGLISFDEWDDFVHQKIAEMPKLEISSEDNDGEPLIVRVDFDRKLRIFNTKTGNNVSRISPKAAKLLQEFISINYE